VGLGDIWFETGLISEFRVQPVPDQNLHALVDSSYRRDLLRITGINTRLRRDLQLAPFFSGTLGLAQFMQLELWNIPWDGEKLGASRASLKITMPGNDNLRAYGAALLLETTLSTEEDVYSRGETTPGFDPLFHIGAVADIDFIKLSTDLPYKAFFNYTNLEDYRLAHAYSQQSISFALAWKGWRKEAFIRTSSTLYKALPTRFDLSPTDRWFGPHLDLVIGFRAFFGDRFWFNAAVSFDPIAPTAFYSDPTHKPPRISTSVEVPILFQETRAEAIRALIYTEEIRKRARAELAKHPQLDSTKRVSGKDSAQGGVAEIRLDKLELRSQSQDSTQATLKELFGDDAKKTEEKRKHIRQEMRQLEELLQ